MASMLWRVLLAGICVTLVFLLIPPFVHLVGFTLSGDMWTIVRVCVAGLAVLYVIAVPPVNLTS
jgi:hypothetical protein